VNPGVSGREADGSQVAGTLLTRVKTTVGLHVFDLLVLPCGRTLSSRGRGAAAWCQRGRVPGSTGAVCAGREVHDARQCGGLLHHGLVDRRSRVLARVFTICGVLLVPWVWVLVEQLHGHAGKRSFEASWVGLDVLEAVCLLSVAQLIRRKHRATSPAAAATAAILCVDAWFDTMSAAPQLPYAEALAMACFAELPLAALLGWTAWHSLKWAAAREDTVTTRAADPATSRTTR
jgi:hypothetical protein